MFKNVEICMYIMGIKSSIKKKFWYFVINDRKFISNENFIS